LIKSISEVVEAMRILCLDCRSEFTGESLIGALADLGVSPSTFEWELSGIEIGDYHLHFDREEIEGMRAVRFGVHGGTVHLDHQHSSDHDHDHTPADGEQTPYVQFRARIETAHLSDSAKSRSLGVLSRIATAQGDLTKTELDQIQFSQADGLAWVVEAVLTCVGLEQLQVKEVFFQANGQPEQIEVQKPYLDLSQRILAALPTPYRVNASPVGAAILSELGVQFDAPPPLKSTKTGYGWCPNGRGEITALRAILGEIG
jgi:uncharacterized protein (DUF111 family)